MRPGIDWVRLILPRHEKSFRDPVGWRGTGYCCAKCLATTLQPFAIVGSGLKVESASFVHLYRKKLAGLKSPNPAALNISQQTRSNIISGELKAGKPPLLLIGIALVNSLMKMAGETSVSVL